MIARNGHTSEHDIGERQRLEEQVAVARLRLELEEVQARERLYESYYGPSGTYAHGDFVQPFWTRPDFEGALYMFPRPGSLHARQDGRNRPFCWTEFDLDEMRSAARWICTKNEVGIGIVNDLVNFTVKRGYTWEARPAKGYEQDDLAKQMAGDCQRVIDLDADLNKLKSRERSSVRRAVRDGEVFVRHFCQDDGTTIHRFVEPEQLREPGGLGANCAHGIETDPRDVEIPLAYHITYDGTEYDRVPASEVSHLKRNVDECVKRGLSDFFSGGENLEGTIKLLRNLRISGAVQAAPAWFEQFPSATKSQVDALSQNRKDLVNLPPPQSPLSGREVMRERVEPGEIRLITGQREFVGTPAPAGASIHIQIVQACMRALGRRWGMSEWMVSGDASTNSYASSLVAGSPFVNAIECEQDDFGLFFLRWRWVAIRNACRKGLLPYAIADVMRMVDLHYTPPQVAVARESEQATIDHQDITAGVMSLETRAERRGLDFSREQERIRANPPTRIQGRVTDIDPQGNPVPPQGKRPPTVPQTDTRPEPTGAPGLRENKDAAGHEHDEKGQFTGSGSGGDGGKSPDSGSGGKSRPYYQPGEVPLFDRHHKVASQYAKNMGSLLAQMHQGNYHPEDVLSDVEQYHDHALTAIRREHARFQQHIFERLDEKYGLDATTSKGALDDIRKAVRQSFAKTAEKLDEMTDLVRGAAKAHKEESLTKRSLRAIAGDIASDSAEMASNMDGFNSIMDAVDAFKARHKSVNESVELPDWRGMLREEWDEAKHPRGQPGNAGQFGSGGSGGSGGGSEPKDASGGSGTSGGADPDANRPSRPENRHKTEDGKQPLPPAKPFQAPPPKTGKKGGGMGARPKGDQSQTRIGDLGESLAQKLGFRSILPPGQRSHKPGENAIKGSTIDLEYDHSGRGYELKLCNTTSTEYRLKAKAKEKQAKELYAKNNDLTPHTLVGVRDVDTGEIHFYASKEPGLIGAEVSDKHYDYIGSVKP